MNKSFAKKGRHTIMPIIGDCVESICISRTSLPEIVFADAEQQQSVIRLEDKFCIGRGKNIEVISARIQDHRRLVPLLECIGATVLSATAFEDGKLELHFSNKLTLSMTSTTGYEAWHFQYPRPGRPYAANSSISLSMHGAGGHLILFSN